MGEIKTKPTGEDVTRFLDSVADDRRRAEGFEMLSLLQRVTGETAMMWGPTMIGFGERPYTTTSGTNTMFILGFSPRKGALTIYGLYDDDGPSDPAFDALGPHTTGKSCLYIKRLDAVDKGVLEGLAERAWSAQA